MTGPGRASDRTDPGHVADEREMLTGWLDYHRATLAIKCGSLRPDQLRMAAVPPSNLSLLGLVRHMAEVERSWFRRTMAGEDAPPIYYTDQDPDREFAVDVADPSEAFAQWAQECEDSRRITAAITSLDTVGRQRRGYDVSLRWVLVHMIEEYARHNGHADLLRQRLDGVTGRVAASLARPASAAVIWPHGISSQPSFPAPIRHWSATGPFPFQGAWCRVGTALNEGRRYRVRSDASGNVECCAGDVGGVVGQQPQHRGGHLVRTADPFHGDDGVDQVVHVVGSVGDLGQPPLDKQRFAHRGAGSAEPRTSLAPNGKSCTHSGCIFGS